MYIIYIYIYMRVYLLYMRVCLHMSARFLSRSRLWRRWLSMAPQVLRCRYLKVCILVMVVCVVCVGRRASGWRRHPWPQWSRNQWEALDGWDCQQEEDAGVRYRGQQGRQLANLVQRSLVFLCDSLPYICCACGCVVSSCQSTARAMRVRSVCVCVSEKGGVRVCEGGGWIEAAQLLSCACGFARVGVSAGVRRTNERASLRCACKCVCARSPVHTRGSRHRWEWVCACVLSVRACVRVEVSV